MAISIVQSTIHGPDHISLPSAPRPGNVVLAVIITGSGTPPTTPSGFTAIGTAVRAGAASYSQLYYRVAQNGDTADLGYYGASGRYAGIAEVSGPAVLDSHAELGSQSSSGVHVSISPTAAARGAIVLATFLADDNGTGCARWGNPNFGTPLPTMDAGWTLLGGGGSPDGNIGLENSKGAVWAYQTMPITSGTYAPGFTWGCSTNWAAQAVALVSGYPRAAFHTSTAGAAAHSAAREWDSLDVQLGTADTATVTVYASNTSMTGIAWDGWRSLATATASWSVQGEAQAYAAFGSAIASPPAATYMAVYVESYGPWPTRLPSTSHSPGWGDVGPVYYAPTDIGAQSGLPRVGYPASGRGAYGFTVLDATRHAHT